MDKKKKIVIILILVTALGVALGYYCIKNPFPLMKLTASKIEVNKPKEMTFHYNNEEVKRLRLQYFVPEESGEYHVLVSDINNDPNACLGLYVANADFTEYLILDNYIPDDTSETPAELGGVTFLQPGQKCYILVVVMQGEERPEPFDGSFSLQVVRNEEHAKPAVLTTEEDAHLRIKTEGRSCARFMPEESGYYRFSTSIVSEDASSGFSSISSIISPDSLRTVMTNGIAYLEQGKEYYVWVTTHETTKKASDVDVSVSQMQLVKLQGYSEVTITEDTIIEYLAKGNTETAVFSSSDGNPTALIYDDPGVALRTDGDSAGSLGENEKDFAMAFHQKEGTVYTICVYGEVGSECKVTIVPYIGDGSSLTINDVDMSVLEDEKAEEDKG